MIVRDHRETISTQKDHNFFQAKERHELEGENKRTQITKLH